MAENCPNVFRLSPRDCDGRIVGPGSRDMAFEGCEAHCELSAGHPSDCIVRFCKSYAIVRAEESGSRLLRVIR